MAKLFVVRHAQVTVDFSIPPSEWRISMEGIDATKELALKESWSGVSCIYHSPESKAMTTAEIISEFSDIPAMCMDGLRELHIPAIQSADEFLRRGRLRVDEWPFYLSYEVFHSCIHWVYTKPEGRGTIESKRKERIGLCDNSNRT